MNLILFILYIKFRHFFHWNSLLVRISKSFRRYITLWIKLHLCMLFSKIVNHIVQSSKDQSWINQKCSSNIPHSISRVIPREQTNAIIGMLLHSWISDSCLFNMQWFLIHKLKIFPSLAFSKWLLCYIGI